MEEKVPTSSPYEHALGETWTHGIYLDRHADHLPSHTAAVIPARVVSILTAAVYSSIYLVVYRVGSPRPPQLPSTSNGCNGVPFFVLSHHVIICTRVPGTRYDTSQSVRSILICSPHSCFVLTGWEMLGASCDFGWDLRCCVAGDFDMDTCITLILLIPVVVFNTGTWY